MRRPALLLALVLVGRVSAPDSAAPPPALQLSVEAYAGALEGILPLVEGGRLEEARERARQLRRAEVEFAGGLLGTDPTVLDAVVNARSSAEARTRAAPIRRLIGALRATQGAAAPSEPDSEVLARLAPDDDAKKGGAVAASLKVKTLSVPERIGKAFLAAYDWVASVVEKVLDWLARFRPRPKTSSSGLGGTTSAAIAVVAVAAFLLAVLAYRTLRHGSGPVVEVESDRLLSFAKDEDPLSREVGEWEKHARDLAAAGRWREAIRAWYHAVLVCLFQQGLLHYQKGRTNWEYAARLPPETSWRPTFLDLTRLFDREWYGRPSSDPEAVRECSRGARAILSAMRGAGEAA